MLPHRDLMHSAKVIGRAVGPDGQTTGSYNADPRFNSLVYDVEFGDGEVKAYAANIIAENLLNQVDDEGFTITHLKSIVSHRKGNTALDESTAARNAREELCRQVLCRPATTVRLLLKDGRVMEAPFEDVSPIVLPNGTRLEVIGHFDNSEENPNNPDPAEWVSWGDQSFEEMFIGYFDWVRPVE